MQTDVKNRAKDTIDEEGRLFINEYIRNSSKVSLEDKEAVSVHGRAKRHHIEPPHTVPVLEPRAGNPRQIEVPYRDAERGPGQAGLHGRPLGNQA
jgi:hypothetical protein